MCIYKHTFLGVHMLFLSKCTIKLTMTKQRLAIFLGVVLESIFTGGPTVGCDGGWASILGEMVHITIFTQDLGSSAKVIFTSNYLGLRGTDSTMEWFNPIFFWCSIEIWIFESQDHHRSLSSPSPQPNI